MTDAPSIESVVQQQREGHGSLANALLSKHTVVSNADPDQGMRHIDLLTQQKAENQARTKKVSSTLESRMVQMKKENQKLLLIQRELLKLDQALGKNIGILRSQIETVGRELSSAQMDFDRKERDYLTARQLLCKKKERKALLTGHLDLLILTNEKHKADKLRRLEAQLGLEDPPPAPPDAVAPSAPSQWEGFSEEEIKKFEL